MKRNLRWLIPCLLLLSSFVWYASSYLPDENTAGATPPPQMVDGELCVHFIDVGQADCALVLCGGQAMLIDGGNVADSSLVVSYLESQGVDHLDYMVCTHAHEDHVGGLSGPLNTCTVSTVFSPVTDYNSNAFQNMVKYARAQGLELTVPRADDVFSLGDAAVTILGPRKDYTDTNNTSIVLRIDFGATSFLFTGDMERDAEADLLEAGCNLSATVLKVGHHGSDTSSSYPFLREVMPQYAVISVGEGNSYGHPNEDTVSRLLDAGAVLYRTDLQGTVVARSDGTQVTFETERAVQPESKEPLQSASPGSASWDDISSGNEVSEASQNTAEDTVSGNAAFEGTYIGNANTYVFHREDCPNLPAEKNRVFFDSSEEAVAQGYTPCGNCMP